MKYWVLLKENEDDFSFQSIEAKSMSEAVEQVDGGVTVVSSYFKKNYSKYNKLWNKLNKHYDVLDDICSIWDSAYTVLDYVLGKDNLLWEKNMIYLDNERIGVDIFNLSDYQFEQLIYTLEEKCQYLK
jgi:hypothetical protein